MRRRPKELADFRSEQNRLKVSNDQVNDALVQLQKKLAAATQASVFAKNIAEVTDEFENLFAVTKTRTVGGRTDP